MQTESKKKLHAALRQEITRLQRELAELQGLERTFGSLGKNGTLPKVKVEREARPGRHGPRGKGYYKGFPRTATRQWVCEQLRTHGPLSHRELVQLARQNRPAHLKGEPIDRMAQRFFSELFVGRKMGLYHKDENGRYTLLKDYVPPAGYGQPSREKAHRAKVVTG